MAGLGKIESVCKALLKRLGILDPDGTYSGGLSGLGAVDNAIVRTDGTSGDAVQGSSVTVDDDGNIVLPPTGAVLGQRFGNTTTVTTIRSGGGNPVQMDVNSQVRASFGPGSLNLTGSYPLTWFPAAITGSPDTGLKRAAAGVLQVTDGGSGSGSILSAAGSQSANGVQVGAANTGLYSASNATRLFLAANGGNYVGANSRGSGELDFMARPAIGLNLSVLARTSDGSEVSSAGANTASTYALQTNRGATGTVTRTLPAAPAIGSRFRFLRVEAQAFRVDVGDDAHQIMRADGTLTTAGHYLELASDGAFLEVVWDGTAWLTLTERGTINEES